MAVKKSPREWQIISFLQHINRHDPKHRAALVRALLFLYDRQTHLERASSATLAHNGVGFNGFDADYLSTMANRAKLSKDIATTEVWPVAKKLMKYAKQLADMPEPARKPKQLALPKGEVS